MKEQKSMLFERTLNGVHYSFEFGKLAKQAGASILCTAGETKVLVLVTMTKEPNEEIDFFPLTVDYSEKLYSAGKIPGGFFKRGGRPSDKEILRSRLMDRPLRPLFPKYMRYGVQIIAYVLSFDGVNAPDMLAINGASIATCISNVPFSGPIAATRCSMVHGEFVANTASEDSDTNLLDLVVAETEQSIMMVEAGASVLTEDVVMQAFQFIHTCNMEMLSWQKEIIDAMPREEKLVVEKPVASPEAIQSVTEFLDPRIEDALFNPDKSQREAAEYELRSEMHKACDLSFEDREKELDLAFDDYVSTYVRGKIIHDNRRPDGRKEHEIRQLSMEVGFLPRTHGSAVFTRGQTQVLSVVTLGGKGEGQLIESIEEEMTKHFMHYYNFPPFSVGEVRPLRGAGRREVGHGALAERAILPVIPPEEKFAYTIHVVSEVLESNGSSSQASICGSILALMDAGVPISEPVAGIAMGLISSGSEYRILTDIQGVEDFSGDMDFKVAGSRNGITAIQMDVKKQIVTMKIIEEGLERARVARIDILDQMFETIQTYRPDLSKYAPRLEIVQISTDRIGDLIGPGGKNIKRIIEETGVKIDIEPDGRVFISSDDENGLKAALKEIEDITREIEPGQEYFGKVVRICDFGAFIELKKGVDGLLHISQISPKRVNHENGKLKVGDEVLVQMGQKLTVKVASVDPENGRVSLTLKGVEQQENE
ncbi:MAG: polyribonucleotide nucleotidyltransferase [Caldisericia bacterium]|nr:polyribonucleotide nucleotidyltransferase [Caldisericia bacterium]